jgi:putative hemolysin
MLELLIIVALAIINGVFSMSEAAVIASRKARLQQAAERGDKGARAALKLANDPERFLSTVQIVITLIGILAGVFGGATVAGQLSAFLATIPALEPVSGPLGYVLVVLLTTYLSLILGELVPKTLALRYPERISSLIARPMRTLARIASPIVTLLTASTGAVLWLIGIRSSDEPPVTQEEIQTMIQQGVDAGVFELSEHEMVEGVFRLGDLRVRDMMQPRPEIIWLDINDPPSINQQKVVAHDRSRFPIGDGDLDQVLGVVDTRDLLARAFAGKTFNLREVMHDALFVPEGMSASKVLELMKNEGQAMAIVLGEYGGVEGLVTLQDVLEEIVGEDEEDEPQVVVRDDGSWLLDGMLSIDEAKEAIHIDDPIPGERDAFDTLGGFVMTQLGRIPEPADSFVWENWRFEVMDMDGKRVDKVLVQALTPPTPVEDDDDDDDDD